jgi:hypothetical protein
MAPEAQLTPKVPSTLKATGRRCHDAGHVSVANRLKIKCLEVVKDYSDPMTMYSAWGLRWLGVIRTLLIDPLTAPINRPYWDHPGGHVFIIESTCIRTFVSRPSRLFHSLSCGLP